MLYDNISNIGKYKDDVKLYEALIALKHYVAGEPYDAGSVKSIGKQDTMTYPMEEAKLEHHRKHIDIHYVIRGSENVLVNYSRKLERLSEYSEEKDFELFAVDGTERVVKLCEGDFLVLYPGESHAPKVAVDGQVAPIVKLIAKVRSV